MKLDGREFSGVDHKITAAQHDYIQAHLSLAGVTDLLVQVAMTKPSEEELGEIRRKFITQILLSGKKSWILSGCLTEAGKKWSREEADRNAARFDEITDQAEQMTMTESLAGVVIGFFQSVGTSSGSSLKFSSPKERDPGTENAERASSESSPQ